MSDRNAARRHRGSKRWIKPSRRIPVTPVNPSPHVADRAAKVLTYWKKVFMFEGDIGSFIYFIQEGDDGPIKIGSATDPLQRLSDLQCGNSRPLRLVHVILAGWDAEPRLHDFWSNPAWMKNARIHREWFGKGHEAAILDMGSRIAERQIEAREAGVDRDEIGDRILRQAMFAQPQERDAA